MNRQAWTSYIEPYECVYSVCIYMYIDTHYICIQNHIILDRWNTQTLYGDCLSKELHHIILHCLHAYNSTYSALLQPLPFNQAHSLSECRCTPLLDKYFHNFKLSGAKTWWALQVHFFSQGRSWRTWRHKWVACLWFGSCVWSRSSRP